MTTATGITSDTLPSGRLLRLVPCDGTGERSTDAAPADADGRPPSSPRDGAAGDNDLDIVLQGDGYTAQAARTPHQEKRASLLVDRMYSMRGYRLLEDTAHPGRSVTLEATASARLYGTMAVAFDTGKGLLADTLYGRELQSLRGAGARLCELSRLAIDARDRSREVFASLIQLAYLLARRIHRASDAVIEVNPRHAAFYERMLGFRRIGEERTCPRVDAPAVLLHLDLAYMTEQIARYAGSRAAAVRTLYPYFTPDCAVPHAEAAVALAV